MIVPLMTLPNTATFANKWNLGTKFQRKYITKKWIKLMIIILSLSRIRFSESVSKSWLSMALVYLRLCWIYQCTYIYISFVFKFILSPFVLETRSAFFIPGKHLFEICVAKSTEKSFFPKYPEIINFTKTFQK